MAGAGAQPGPHRIRLSARHFVLSAGAIGSPALLLRSALPDPHELAGTRTFLHPTVVSAAVMPRRSTASRARRSPSTPTTSSTRCPSTARPASSWRRRRCIPILAGITLPGFGPAHARWMKQFANLQVVIALLRDGFHPESPGGRVRLRGDGSPGARLSARRLPLRRACAAPISRWPRSSSPPARGR